MSENRFARLLAITAAVIYLFPTARTARADSAPHGALQTPRPAPSAAQAKSDSIADDFAGLTYTDEQKAQIAKIRQDTESKKTLVANSTLNGDQKDAMLLGYTRMEYGQIFKVLTPEQQRQVRKRMQDRKLADQAAQRKQTPPK